MTATETGDPTYGRWSYPAFFAALGLYVMAIVALSAGVNEATPESVVGAYWLGALAGLIYLERLLERWLF